MSRHAIITPRRAQARSGGFTLVELLVTVTIIAILATMVLGSLHVARESAREVKTKSTITKLNRIVMEQYESYRTRRVPINTAGLPPRVVSYFRLRAIRELMRMEMPERLSDITDPGSTSYATDPPEPGDIDLVVTVVYAPGVEITLKRPARARAFFRRVLQSHLNGTLNNKYDSAEYLYLLVGFVGHRDQFNENEVGDVDRDGWPEFVDGWGNPIAFLRWAPGFTESDVQQRTFVENLSPPPDYLPDPGLVAAAAISDHDPFDSRNIHTNAYRLVPLIYSAGPDGIYDIDRNRTYYFEGNPYYRGSGPPNPPNLSGAPVDSANTSLTATGPANGSLDHYDNIHNHRIKAE